MMDRNRILPIQIAVYYYWKATVETYLCSLYFVESSKRLNNTSIAGKVNSIAIISKTSDVLVFKLKILKVTKLENK
jgi:hypothetical protein